MLRSLSLAGIFVAMAAVVSAAGQDIARTKPSTDTTEPWADPGLKVTKGLALWLDAGRLNAARKAHGRDEVSTGSRVDTWYDASGLRRDLAQARQEAQPLYHDGGLRFDGKASHLERAGVKTRLTDLSLFLVAAPFSNEGGFRALMAMNQEGREDFTSGLTVDMGFGFTGKFDVLNVEGKGFGGMDNLMADPSGFGVVRRMTITSSPGRSGTKLWVDGRPGRVRDRKESVLDVDRLLSGARYYGLPPIIRGYFDGDILEVLLYDRLLDDAERQEVEGYLAAKLGGKAPIVREGRPTIGKPLLAVKNPPAVQMLMPGFSARELPLDLTNVNNLKYRSDGKLVALCYSGEIYLLSDSNGDGLEDRAELFWDSKGSLTAPIGMALAPPGYRLGDGVFVASKGKVSLIADVDRDGKADKEIVVARGWKELPHGVDALGVALDGAGNIYFGLGTTDFTNAYQVDTTGRRAYELKNEHGTIQKVTPDFATREIIATGIRFPVALAFNRLGDLFATDQEGARATAS
jgi:hypothetical protein